MSSNQTDTSSNKWLSLFIKRIMDIVLCTMVLLITLPLLLIMPILVKLSSPGRVFFLQKRAGREMKSFEVIKFRTMKTNLSAQSTVWSKEEEERITSIGRFLRDYGLDELPQLWNILKGDMSIIGPRAMLEETAISIPEQYRSIFRMRPGVLSLAVIAGRRTIPMEKRIELHAQYVEEWSLALDFKILWKSLFVVLFRQDANEVLSPLPTDKTETK